MLGCGEIWIFDNPDCVFGRSYQSGNEEICSKTADLGNGDLKFPQLLSPWRSVAGLWHLSSIPGAIICDDAWDSTFIELHCLRISCGTCTHTHTQSEKISIQCFLIAIATYYSILDELFMTFQILALKDHVITVSLLFVRNLASCAESFGLDDLPHTTRQLR